MNAPRARGRLPLTVVLLGFTSFLTDLGADMIFPLLPLFLTTELGAGAAFLGTMEGAADTVQSALQLVSGRLSDRVRSRRPLVLLGYLLAVTAKPLVAVATAPWQVFVLRAADRSGKGIRTSPRDALLADVAPVGAAGRVYGFHRAMDHAGSLVGPLVAALLLWLGMSLRNVFLSAAIPGILSVLLLLRLREPERPARAGEGETIGGPLPREFRRYLLAVGAFAIGVVSDALLLLRANELGVGSTQLTMLYAAMNASKVVLTMAGGRLADRFDRRLLVAPGWLVAACVYVGLAFAASPGAVWFWFVAYGAYYGLTEPAERALVKELVPAAIRGRAFGTFHLVLGAASLPSGIAVGLIWKSFGAPIALISSAAVCVVAAALLLLLTRPERPAR